MVSRHRDTFVICRAAGINDNPKELVSVSSTKADEATKLLLPEEMMIEIFKHSQIVSKDQLGRDHRDWCWLTITHVCKRWREIAIGAQELWTHLETHRHATPEQTLTYLERSGASLLTIGYTYNFKMKSDSDIALKCLYLALSHISRIRELHISLRGDFSARLCTLISSHPAPELKKLSLETCSKKAVDISLRTLFAGQAPQLIDYSWRITPRNLYLNADSPIFVMRNLRNLCIDSSSGHVSLSPLMILSILIQCPYIRQLKIGFFSLSNSDRWLESDEPGSPDLDNPWVLQNLLHLEIHGGEYIQISKLLKNIALPRIIGWDIDCSDYPFKRPFEEDPKTAVPSLSSNWRDCVSLKVSICSDRVAIKADPNDVVRACYAGENIEISVERAITYSWSEEKNAEDCFAFVCSVIKNGFWDSAIELAVIIEDSFFSDSEGLGVLDWMGLLKLFPNLQKMFVCYVECLEYAYSEGPKHIIKETHHGLINALSATILGRDGNTPLLCPNLSELYLCGLDFENGYTVLARSLTSRVANHRVKRLSALYLDTPFGMTEEILSSLEEQRVAEAIKVIKRDEADDEE